MKAKNKNLIANTSYNFKLRKKPSIFIGLYIILGALLIKTILKGFITDSSPFGFLTVDLLELFILAIILLIFALSSITLFFGNRKHMRKIGFKLWNTNSKKQVWFFFLLILTVSIIEFYLLRVGLENFLIPTFLIAFGLITLLLNFSRTKQLYLFAMVSFSLGLGSLLFPNFDFGSLLLLGISVIAYGFLNKSE